jgi:hypothetical protein
MSFEATDFLAGLYGDRRPDPTPSGAGLPDRPEAPTPGPEGTPSGQADGPTAGETSAGGLPTGWPGDVVEPLWWPELAGLGIPIRSVRPERCGGCGFGASVNWRDAAGNWRWSCPACGRRSGASAEAEPVASPDAARGRTAESTRHPWPGALGDWVLLLTPGDLPERFTLRRGVVVDNRRRFLAALQQDIRRGPSGPRARFGALQGDLGALRRVLLGGPTEKPASQNRPESTQSGLVESEHVRRKRPSQGPSGGFSNV